MKRLPYLGILPILTLGCAGPEASTGSPTSPKGGELAVTDFPAAPLRVEGDHLVVWAEAELPPNSRLQAARATIEAITRARLLEVVEIRIESAMRDESHASGLQRIKTVTRTSVGGLIKEGIPVQWGWQRSDVLRVVGRITVSREQLLRAVEAHADAETSRTIVERLLTP